MNIAQGMKLMQKEKIYFNKPNPIPRVLKMWRVVGVCVRLHVCVCDMKMINFRMRTCVFGAYLWFMCKLWIESDWDRD